MARRIIATLALLVLAACGRQSDGNPAAAAAARIVDPIAVPAYVAAALADPARAMHQPTDARRHPAELIAFSGLEAGDRVLDLIPGDGYWTRIFSRIVGPEGRVYSVWPQAYADVAQGNVRTLQALAATPQYANIRVAVEPTATLTAPEPLDLVWTSQNYHDYPDAFMGHIDPSVLNRAAFAMLKPGGTWFIIDHAAAPGAGMADTERLHRIDRPRCAGRPRPRASNMSARAGCSPIPPTIIAAPCSTRRSAAIPISSSCASASRSEARRSFRVFSPGRCGALEKIGPGFASIEADHARASSIVALPRHAALSGPDRRPGHVRRGWLGLL
jgi:predicted methyltransferase